MPLTAHELGVIPAARLGELILRARRNARVSRAELAARLAVPLAQVVSWEQGTERSSAQTLVAVAAALEVSLDVLIPPRRAASFAPDAVGDQVQAFVRLIQTMRRADQGSDHRFRLADLQQLSVALGTQVDDVEARIAQVLTCSAADAQVLRRQLVNRRLLSPLAAGVFADTLMSPAGEVLAAQVVPAQPVR